MNTILNLIVCIFHRTVSPLANLSYQSPQNISNSSLNSSSGYSSLNSSSGYSPDYLGDTPSFAPHLSPLTHHLAHLATPQLSPVAPGSQLTPPGYSYQTPANSSSSSSQNQTFGTTSNVFQYSSSSSPSAADMKPSFPEYSPVSPCSPPIVEPRIPDYNPVLPYQTAMTQQQLPVVSTKERCSPDYKPASPFDTNMEPSAPIEDITPSIQAQPLHNSLMIGDFQSEIPYLGSSQSDTKVETEAKHVTEHPTSVSVPQYSGMEHLYQRGVPHPELLHRGGLYHHLASSLASNSASGLGVSNMASLMDACGSPASLPENFLFPNFYNSPQYAPQYAPQFMSTPMMPW